MRLLDLGGLAEKGIRVSNTHIWRLIKAGQFPQPMRIGRRAYWSEAEIDGFIEEKLARRNPQNVATSVAMSGSETGKNGK